MVFLQSNHKAFGGKEQLGQLQCETLYVSDICVYYGSFHSREYEKTAYRWQVFASYVGANRRARDVSQYFRLRVLLYCRCLGTLLECECFAG